jgi:beta-glucosidase
LRAPFLRKRADEDKAKLLSSRAPASVALDIASGPFAFYGIHMKYTVEPGEFGIIAGNSSRDADLQKAILTVAK